MCGTSRSGTCMVKRNLLTGKNSEICLEVCQRDWTASYTDLLECCLVPTLSEGRKNAKLCHLYKIIHGLADCQMAPVSIRTLTHNTRRSNPVQLQPISVHSSQFQCSFYPHTISLCMEFSILICWFFAVHLVIQTLTYVVIVIIILLFRFVYLTSYYY